MITYTANGAQKVAVAASAADEGDQSNGMRIMNTKSQKLVALPLPAMFLRCATPSEAQQEAWIDSGNGWFYQQAKQRDIKAIICSTPAQDGCNIGSDLNSFHPLRRSVAGIGA